MADWLKNQKEIFTQKTSLYIHNLPSVLKRYGSIDEATLDQLKADPYVIAHALLLQGCVVTGERPNNATAPHNKKIPSICGALHIPCYTLPRFMWEVRDIVT